MLPIFNRSKTHDHSSRRSVERLTLNRFFDEQYFPHCRITKRHCHHDWSIFNTHMRAQLGHYHLYDLTNPVLDVWVREQVVKGLKRSTVNKGTVT